MTTTDFSSLPLAAEVLANIASLDYKEMTPIQAQSLPAILEGKDILAQAKTGSGKTAAFAIGLLNKIETRQYKVQALVLCPTRELADQVSTEIRRLARAIPNIKLVTLCGGKSMLPQLAALEHPPHIIVGTPGRILKHIDKESLVLINLNTLVLDEADRMLDMGFYDEIINIINKTPKQKQTLLFSATYPDQILSISKKLQNNPVQVRVESIHDDKEIQQLFYEVEAGGRTKALSTLLHYYKPESSIVFCNTKQQCQELVDDLWKQGFHVLAIHGDLEQRERDQVIVQFANKSSSILIATDVAARGIDIKELNAVINYELSPDPEIHIHRIGRTGRAGNQGLALSLFLASEKFRIEAIENFKNGPVRIDKISKLKMGDYSKLIPPMVTLGINAGRKDKMRAGDILGALTASNSVNGIQIGKIDIFDKYAYVAVEQSIAKQALKILSEGKIKGRKFKIRRLK
ncbi:MAG: ATP-dependent RNA helicase DbpA [Proteobacteria bacterium]|nr:ATP-dependent RNA helicase DbpA [Pseudomonadota bacterium]NOG60028.1 ATP-dependent RNA helicase DbpA [Pseudomonadota bacterium]